jgi:hypothetical protein
MTYEVIFYDHGLNGSTRNSKNKGVVQAEIKESGLELTLRQVDTLDDIKTSSSQKSRPLLGLTSLMLLDELPYAIILNSSADNFSEALAAAKTGCDLHGVNYKRIIVIGNPLEQDGYQTLKTKAGNGYLTNGEAKQLVGMLKALQPV